MPGYRARCTGARSRLPRADPAERCGLTGFALNPATFAVAVLALSALLAAGGCDHKPVVLAVAATQDPEASTAPSGRRLPSVLIGPDEAEGEYDLGFVEPRGRRRVAFVLENGRAAPMQIRKVKSGCECIYLVAGPTVIPPRASGEFLVEFHAPRIVTEYRTEIVLFTSDSSRPLIPLSVRARIGLPLGFRPRMLKLGRIATGQERRKLVALVNDGDRAVRLIGARVTGSECEVAVPVGLVAAGGEVMVAVTITPAGTPGARTETVTVLTDSEDQPRVTLPVRYRAVESKSRGSPKEPRAKKRRNRTHLCYRR
ncbi:MAG: COG1470 family protein [Planctomycetota bacterium]|jgi:hypothetical protein